MAASQKQATYLTHRQLDIEDIQKRVSRQLSDVREQIRKARDAASAVKISVTNQRSGVDGWRSDAGCSRAYRLPGSGGRGIEASLVTKVSLVYGLDNDQERDGMLGKLLFSTTVSRKYANVE